MFTIFLASLIFIGLCGLVMWYIILKLKTEDMITIEDCTDRALVEKVLSLSPLEKSRLENYVDGVQSVFDNKHS